MKSRLAELAAAEGFDLFRVAAPDSIGKAGDRLLQAIAAGHHGTMDWLPETATRRSDPRNLWPDVRSIALFGLNYGPDSDPLESLEQPDVGTISVYARNRDYHDIIKGALKRIGSQFAAAARRMDLPGDLKVFVDTAPVMEKPLAEAAGLGWQGKHTNLVSRSHGSWLFLGVLFTNAELPVDTPETDHCGQCQACLDICPTDAFPAPYQLDARRCISYLTIEHKGPIDRALRPAIGNRIFGCDDCLAICPWNKFAQVAREAKLAARDDLNAPALADLAALDDPAFRSLFSGSPVKRIGRNRFLRNVLIAIGNSGGNSGDNSGDRALVPAAQNHLHDPDPLVRGAAVWALSRLCGDEEFADLERSSIPSEADETVCEEWRAAREARQ